MFIISCANYDLLKFYIGFDREINIMYNIMYFYLFLCFDCCQSSTNNNNNNNKINIKKTSFYSNNTEKEIIFVHELFN